MINFRKLNKKTEKINFLILILISFFFWYTQIIFLPSYLANDSYSVLSYVHVSLDPIANLINWPSGVENLEKSLLIKFFILIHKLFSFSLINITKYFIFAEIIITLFANYFLFRSLVNSKNLILALIFTLITSVSNFTILNLARFDSYYWGLFYNISYSMGIIGYLMMRKNNFWISSFSHTASFLIHPIIGLGCIFLSLTANFKKIYTRFRDFFFPALLFGLLTLLWLINFYQFSEISLSKIPFEDWLNLTKVQNYHWYPFYIGLFKGVLAHVYFFPTISVLVLYLISYNRLKHINFISLKEINLIVVSLIFISLAGIMISYFEFNSTLIKISLHRLSNILVIFSLIPVIYYLWLNIKFGNYLIKTISIFFLLSPFLMPNYPGFPLEVTIIYILLKIFYLYKKKNINELYLLSFILISVLIIYVLCGTPKFFLIKGISYLSELYKYVHFNIKYSIIVITITFTLTLTFFLYYKIKNILISIVVTILILVPSINWLKNQKYNSNKYLAYYETQIWAKNNSQKSNLFMISPHITSSWRDVSERASFGTAREWLHNSWLYSSNLDVYSEGIRRFELLGLKSKTYYGYKFYEFQKTLRNDIINAFYNFDSDWFADLAKKESIDFFVFEKEYMKNKNYGLDCVYKNQFYIICKTK